MASSVLLVVAGRAFAISRFTRSSTSAAAAALRSLERDVESDALARRLGARPWGDVDRFDNNRNVEVVGSSPITSTNPEDQQRPRVLDADGVHHHARGVVGVGQ